MTGRPPDWPPSQPIVKCPNGHPVTYWVEFQRGGWRIRLSPRWERDGDGWRRGKRSRHPWSVDPLPDGHQRDELPHGAHRDKEGIYLSPPLILRCPVGSCGAFTTARTP